jgi:hypothetical protein
MQTARAAPRLAIVDARPLFDLAHLNVTVSRGLIEAQTTHVLHKRRSLIITRANRGCKHAHLRIVHIKDWKLHAL